MSLNNEDNNNNNEHRISKTNHFMLSFQYQIMLKFIYQNL